MKRFLGVFLKSAAFFMGWAICAGVMMVDVEHAVWWRFFAELIPLLAIAAFTLLFWLLEKRELCFDLRGRPVQSIGIGLAAGVLWLGSGVGFLFLLDAVDFRGGGQVELPAVWACSVLLNAAMQELLVRGYLYQLVKKNYGPAAAAVVTTALFTLLHGGAFEAGLVPVLNVATMSLLMTAALETARSLWTPIVMHFVWNFSGAVLLNVVSLADDYPHLLNAEPKGSALISGGAYKIEGSIVVLLLNLLLMAGFMLWGKRKKAAADVI